MNYSENVGTQKTRRSIGTVLNTFRDAMSTRNVQPFAIAPCNTIGMSRRTEIGKRIKAGRDLAKLSQQQLGEKCGWSGQSRISMYERGEREPTFDDLERISRHIELNLTDLVPHSGANTLQQPLALYGGVASTESRLLRAFSLLTSEEKQGYLSKIEADAIANAALKQEVGPRLRPVQDKAEKHTSAAPSLARSRRKSSKVVNPSKHHF